MMVHLGNIVHWVRDLERSFGMRVAREAAPLISDDPPEPIALVDQSLPLLCLVFLHSVVPIFIAPEIKTNSKDHLNRRTGNVMRGMVQRRTLG